MNCSLGVLILVLLAPLDVVAFTTSKYRRDGFDSWCCSVRSDVKTVAADGNTLMEV